MILVTLVEMSESIALSTSLFYGDSEEKCQVPNKVQNTKGRKCIMPYVPRNLLHGPNILWKVFKKQDEALEFMKSCKDGLMCFAFEHFGTGRLFLVAHPEVFWHYDVQRDSNSRSTYEIIPEFTACKIYIDLEFDIILNKVCDGFKMVDIFINLLRFYLKTIWDMNCGKEHILILDSTTNSKFSRHLIFNLPSMCFTNSYQVGFFVKYVCQNIKSIIDSGLVPENMIKQFTIDDFYSLKVIDAKGNSRIFCDEGVYTKNRHFRLYGSTKKGKHSNLVLSPDNLFQCRNELEIFLSSLITFIDVPDVRTLELQDKFIEKRGVPKPINLPNKEVNPSPYPILDKFITDLVMPGKIYRSVYFGAKKILVYDVVGNRYCGNIKREHKSNNVKYVVDLNECFYYQKCYDYECFNYRSEKVPLPYEVIFKITDNSDIDSNNANNLGVFGLSSSDIEQVLDAIEAVGHCFDNVPKKELKKFPSFGLSDEDFMNVNY